MIITIGRTRPDRPELHGREAVVLRDVGTRHSLAVLSDGERVLVARVVSGNTLIPRTERRRGDNVTPGMAVEVLRGAKYVSPTGLLSSPCGWTEGEVAPGTTPDCDGDVLVDPSRDGSISLWLSPDYLVSAGEMGELRERER